MSVRASVFRPDPTYAVRPERAVLAGLVLPRKAALSTLGGLGCVISSVVCVLQSENPGFHLSIPIPVINLCGIPRGGTRPCREAYPSLLKSVPQPWPAWNGPKERFLGALALSHGVHLAYSHARVHVPATPRRGRTSVSIAPLEQGRIWMVSGASKAAGRPAKRKTPGPSLPRQGYCRR